MKVYQKIITISVVGLLGFFIGFTNVNKALKLEKAKQEEQRIKEMEISTNIKQKTLLASLNTIQNNYYDFIETAEEVNNPIVYDGMTLDELSAKLDKSLKSTLKGKGYLYASYSLEKGVDPYLAVAVTLHETGCNWKCSELVRKCNNVGGQKGRPGCNGGSYQKFSTLDEGIKAMIDNLKVNYYNHGLNTPEKMNRKYAASKSWSSKVNYYIKSIKSK